MERVRTMLAVLCALLLLMVQLGAVPTAVGAEAALRASAPIANAAWAEAQAVATVVSEDAPEAPAGAGARPCDAVSAAAVDAVLAGRGEGAGRSAARHGYEACGPPGMIG